MASNKIKGAAEKSREIKPMSMWEREKEPMAVSYEKNYTVY